MDQAEWKLLKEIAELEKTPQGAYNIRRNGALDSRNSTANIEITTKTEPGKSGIDIRIKPGTRHESVHIPVIISQTGLSEMVYNDFFIGEDCDVDIVAGCETSQHDGVHTFYVGKNSKVRYVERHYGEGPGTGKRIMNPQTVVYLEEGATINLESTQIRGVDSTKRETKIVVGKDAEAIITEKLLTHGEQTAESDMEIILDGEGANGRVVSPAWWATPSASAMCSATPSSWATPEFPPSPPSWPTMWTPSSFTRRPSDASQATRFSSS